MKSLKISLILLAVLFATCKEEADVVPAGSDELFLAFKGASFDFRMIDVIHDRNESLIFFWDAFTKKGIIYNYSTRKAISLGKFAINQDGYADLGYAYFNNKPEIYIPNDTKVEVISMRDLQTTLSIDTGHPVAGVSVSGNVISVGYCDRSMETYNRITGVPISQNSIRGGLCERVESSFYRDTLRVIGFPSGLDAFIVNNHNRDGAYIFGKTVGSSLIFRPLIRASESAGYFITSDKGHVYLFDGKYVGKLPASGGTLKDYAFSSDGNIIYALYANGNIQRFSYPSLQELGQTFIREDDVNLAPERIFTDDQNLIRIYDFASSATSTQILLRIVPLSKIEN